ncbi:hypothetical protein [Natrinema amylolyticum]|uniref:hypothetical protein n=1 Tax=Natrinema amylolyticum TaxID=2878679 RepID=UPI001CFB60A7|nr:hypothetical protein [Natrinema amylolyticum]
MIDELSFLANLQEAYLEEGNWSKNTISISDQSIDDIDKSDLKSIVEKIADRPRWFRDFQLSIPAPSSYETETLLLYLQNGVCLKQQGVDLLLASTEQSSSDWAGRISDQLSGENYRDGVELIYDILSISGDGQLRLSISINKSNIKDDLFDECDIEIGDSSPQFWTSKKTLEYWIDDKNVESIIESQFSGTSTPYHCFLDGDSIVESQYVGFISLYSLLNGGTDYYPVSCQSSYEEEQSTLTNLFDDTDFNPPRVSPLIFDNPVLRDIYEPVFISSAIACLATTHSLDGNHFEAETKTDRHHASSQIDFGDPTTDTIDDRHMPEIYKLLEEVVHPDGPSSLTHWHRSVATHCSSFTEISTKNREISHYYGFLREEDAKKELDQLQNTIEEAFELTRTVATSLSEASQSLTSDIQKIIITLLAAIVTNFVLILRYSDLAVLAPFSISAIAGILIFYFPIIQNEIGETQAIMENRTGDFIVYLSEIRSHVGTRVFDLGKIEDQHEIHLKTAYKSLENAKQTISKIYYILVLIWAIIIFYSTFVISEWSPNSITVLLNNLEIQTSVIENEAPIKITLLSSTIPSLWLLYKLYSHFETSEANFWSSSLRMSSSTSDTEITFPEIRKESTKPDEVDIDLFEDITPQHYFEYCPLLLVLLLGSMVLCGIISLYIIM